MRTAGDGIGDEKEKIGDGHPLKIHSYAIPSPTPIPKHPYPFHNPALHSYHAKSKSVSDLIVFKLVR